MGLITKILVATDFSSHACAAAEYAARLAKEVGASLTLLHSYQALLATRTAEPVTHPGMEAALQQEKTEASRQGAPQVDIAMEQGAPFHTITKFAREGNFDLIVVGTHGRTGVRRSLLGSVAEHVSRHAHCPVMVIRSPADGEKPGA
jgi:universal stress protein A